MGLSVWRETSKKLTVYRVCYTPIETLNQHSYDSFPYRINPLSFLLRALKANPHGYKKGNDLRLSSIQEKNFPLAN